MTHHLPSLAAAVLLAVAGAAQAATFDLAADFSDASNPNGAWSFVQGGTALSHQTSCSPGNPFSASLGNGYWGAGCNLDSSTPEIAKVTANGTASAQTTNDWLTGDVIVHSTNPGAGQPIVIDWTAPAAGFIDYAVAAWYAHSSVARSNDVALTLRGSTLGIGFLATGVDRSHALTFSGTHLAVSAGDVFAITLTPTAGQSFGSLAGVSETFQFTAAVPEPSAWMLMILGGGALAWRVRQSRR